MNDKKHWNEIAPTYNDEIFDVFQSDSRKVLKRYFNRHRHLQHVAVDFGCGNGKAFHYLSPRFAHVHGLDISSKLLRQAEKLPYQNVSLQQVDLTQAKVQVPAADFAFCCNVAILNTVEKNLAVIKNVGKVLKPDGAALFVIPSLESMLFSSWRLIDWYKKEGVRAEKIDPDEWAGFSGKRTDILQGLISINGVTTKHYTEPEIEIIFPRCGLVVTKIEKIEYDWKSEFSEPPRWMKEPFPWDWMVECRKK